MATALRTKRTPWTRRHQVLLFFAVFVTILGSRFYGLDQYVTIDEHKWLARSANFYRAIRSGDLEGTYQTEHPGVTTMWAGAAGFLWKYPAYPAEVTTPIGDDDIEAALHGHDRSALEMLAAGRLFMVIANALALAVAALASKSLLGLWPTVVGFLLIAFDPFHVAHTQLLHLDGLASSFITLSLLAFIHYLQSRRWPALFVSAVAAGLGWLTKSPAVFLVPAIVGITLAGMLLDRQKKQLSVRHAVMRALPVLVVWGAVATLIFVALWPAMWVEPVETIQKIVTEALAYAGEGHNSPIFFDGAIITGHNLEALRFFYPVSWLWRTTPVALLGLVMSFLLVRHWRSTGGRKTVFSVVALLAFVLVFVLLIDQSIKKFDRYLLPVFPALNLVAGVGWVAFASWLATKLLAWRLTAVVPVLLLTLAVVGQIFAYTRVMPYPLSYYNPLLGGATRAQHVVQIGWGEGLDEAARYLNQKDEAESLQVLSWYYPSFSYYFDGTTFRIPTTTGVDEQQLATADYAVIYIHQWQRRLPESLLAMLEQRAPEHTVAINGIEYARIYQLR